MFLRSVPFLVCASSGLLFAPAARGQTSLRLGPRVGLNLATYHFDESAKVAVKYRPGLEAGVAGVVRRGAFALHVAALYSQKGLTNRYSIDIRDSNNTIVDVGDGQSRSRLHYVVLPLSLAYGLGPDGRGPHVFAGPYLGVLLGGNYQSTVVHRVSGATYTSEGRIRPVNDEAPDLAAYTRRVDAGVQAGVGYQHGALLLQAASSLGLRNGAPKFFFNGVPVTTNAYYNRVVQGSLTYLFGPQN